MLTRVRSRIGCDKHARPPLESSLEGVHRNAKKTHAVVTWLLKKSPLSIRQISPVMCPFCHVMIESPRSTVEVRATLLFCLAPKGTCCGLFASSGPKPDVAWDCRVAWLPV